MKKLLLVLYIFIGLSAGAQQPNLDSLNNIWLNESAQDTVRFKCARLIIGYGFLNKNSDTAIILSKKLFEQAKRSGRKKYMGNALNLQAIATEKLGKYNEALQIYSTSLELYSEADFKIGAANVLGNMGQVFLRQGKLEKSISHQAQSLKLKKEIGSKAGVAATLQNIGNVYDIQGDSVKAMNYYKQSEEQSKSIGDSLGVAMSRINIGRMYDEQGHPEKALQYYFESLNILKVNNDSYNMALLLNNIGASYLQLRNYYKSLDYFNQSLEINKQMGNESAIPQTMISIGWLYEYQNNYAKATEYGTQALELANGIGDLDYIYKAANLLATVYKNQKMGMKALEMYELEVQINDSIKSIEAQKGILKMEVEHEFEKQQLIAEQEAEEAARMEAEKVSRRNSIQYSGIGLGIFALFGLVFLFGRIQLPNWAVELSVFLPFLILFEFLLVITDPYVDSWSGGEPLIKLGLNVLMAGAIFPLHSFFERFLKQRLFKNT